MVEEIEVYQKIVLSISEELKKTMEERRILETDIQKVIHFAECTNFKIFNPTNNRFTSHFKEGNTTFWVQYGKKDLTFEIFNVYSHRLDLE
ncbi:MAG: hypothetical protein WCF96_05180 [Eubacteriales bacterium]